MALKDKLMTLEDFKAVRDVDVASNSAQFTAIKADLGSQTGIISLLKDFYIKTSTTPISLTPIASTVGRMCAVIDCVAGDKFVINAYSNSAQARAWCFIDSTNTALSMADELVTITDTEITAPTNASKLIINDVNGGMSYKVGNNLASKIWTVSDALEGNTLSTGARNALINFLDKVTVTDSEGNALLETLKLAMLGDFIAVYEQTAIVDMGTNLDTLKTNLSVKAVRSDGTIADVDEYELSGNLGEEISDITVTTNRASAVFKVLCAPSGRWVNNTLTISSNELAQGSFNGTPPEYTNGSMARLLYKGAKIDFDKRYRYTVSINSSKTVNVAVRGMKKSAFNIYKNKESFVGTNTSTDTGWQSNGYIFNSDGSADDELAFLWIPIKRTDNETILLSDVTSIIVTRALR